MASIEEHKELVRRAIDAWNEQDRDRFAACHAEDVVFHGANEDIHGRDEVMAHQWSFFDAFSDNTITVGSMIAENDTVALRYTTSGTHDGTFEGIEPTGERVDMAQMAMVRVDGGKIAEKWVQADTFGLIQQLSREHPG